MRILHLEDSEPDAEMIGELLRQEWPGCHITQVTSGPSFESALRTGGHDLIISDYSLPGYNGLAAVTLAHQLVPTTPFIFVSGTIGEERAVEAVRRGATDYVIKDRPGRLVPAIRAALALVESRRKRELAEERIREQAALLDQANEAICVADLDGRVTYWNASAARIYGWSAEEAIGRAIKDLLFSADEALYRRALDRTLSQGEWRGEIRQNARDGAPLIVKSAWTRVLDSEGKPRAVLLLNADITTQKKMELQLLRAQRLDSIGHLTGGVAHDLNNVLSPIVMAVGLIKSQDENSEWKDVLRIVEESAERGASLVRQLLTFARGSEGVRVNLPLREVILDLEALLNRTLPGRIKIEVSHAEPQAVASADPTQLNQVLMNLCINARDAMPDGGTLRIRTETVNLGPEVSDVHPEVQPGPHARITISDTGTGIPPEVVAHIFDPFFTTKEPGKGTGLGLSTVLGIVKSHGGYIDLETAPGNGTSFFVHLPSPGGIIRAP